MIQTERTAMKTNVVTSSAHEEVIVMTRTFDAPREVVWSALVDPKHVAKWYGGHGFTNPVCEMDVRPGGLWRHVMRTPNGDEYKLEFVFVEVTKPEKLVWQDANYGKRRPGGPPSSIMTVTLEEAGSKQTKWTLVTRFNTTAERELAMKMGFTSTLAEGTEKFNDIVKALVTAGEPS
jgi:uncharacterized protein YndB with AHSA1/START domain